MTRRSTGEFVDKYFTKGRMACVSGSLQLRNWTDKDGNSRRQAEVVADNVYFADSKNTADSGSSGATSYTPTQQAAAPAAGNFAPIDEDDDDLPF